MQHMQSLHAANGEQAVVFIDQGRFGFTEFSAAHAPSSDALAVTGGVHVVEIVPSELACRALTFPALDPALKVLQLLALAFHHSSLSPMTCRFHGYRLMSEGNLMLVYCGGCVVLPEPLLCVALCCASLLNRLGPLL